MKNKYTNVPVAFSATESIDSRFIKLRIVLMHLGENFNGSYFDKEIVEKAIPTLANTPILGFIEEGAYGDKDFSDHRMEIVKDEDGYKTKYLGSAYGVIPEDNNARFENIAGSDGVERTYLVCDGLMWTKFDDSADIAEQMTYRNQSMELDEKYDGFFDRSSGLFHFTDFKFYGACILSNSVEPAMINAKVEKMFSSKDYMAHIQDKMEEFKVSYSKYLQSTMDDEHTNEEKEVRGMNEKFLELLAKYSLTEEVAQANGVTLEDYATEEDLEAGLVKVAEAINHTEDQVIEGVDNIVEPEAPEAPEAPEVANDFEAEIAVLKGQLEVAQTEYEALKVEFADNQSKFEALVSETEELRNFKSTALAKEREVGESELFEQFSTQLSEEEMAPLKEKASAMDLSTIETSLYAMVGKKTAKFSKQEKEKDIVKVGFSRDEKKADVSGYEYILEKHLK